MPTVVCHHCSSIFTFDGPKPNQCPSCGQTLHIEGDPTPTGPPRELHSTLIQPVDPQRGTIGRYIVQSRLGAGGFGTVFLARDPQLDRPVAIKIPRGESARSKLGRDRFTREARNIAQLRHEGIVSVFDVELDDELPFIVCEYVAGETLSDRMRKGPLSFRETARLIAEVATAVEFAHESGIIHRDIKPSNIMIDSAGKSRLMDFGLAKREEIDPTVTSEHAILGTPAYMPPEQAWGGKRGPVDRRSDVYALGAVLYHLLTRELPFHGEPRMVLRQVIEDDPKSPRTLNAEIPLDLETICNKAMQKEPGNRYQTAGALAGDLTRWLNNEPIEARPATRLERSWRWCRRNPAPAGLIASVLVFLLALSGGMWGYAAVQTTARRNADNAKKEIEEVLAQKQELLSRAYVEKGSRYVRGPQTSDEYNPLKSLPWSYEAMKLDEKNPDRLLADRIRLQTQLDLGSRLEGMWFFKGEVRSSGLSPKRDTFYIAGADGTVNIWRIAENGPPIPPLVHPAVAVAAYSPDGKRLATCCEDGLRIWEVDSGRLLKGPLVPAVPHAKMHVALATSNPLIVFDHSGSYLFAAMRMGLNQIWDSRTGQPIGPPIVGQADSADFADSGRLVVLFGLRDHAIHVYDVRTGAEKYVLRGEKRAPPKRTEIFLTAMVSPGGARIAGVCVSGDFVLWKAATGEKLEQQVALESPAPAHSAAFSPDGELLAMGMLEGTVRVWRLRDGHSLWGHNVISGTIDRLQFSPDGSTLAVANNAKRLCVLAAETGTMIAPPVCNDSRLDSADWVDSAGRILTVDVDGVARLWNLENNLPVVRLPFTKGIQSATISANRRVLATTDMASVCLLRLPANGHPDADGLKLVPLRDLTIDAIALNADGSKLAISGEHQVSIWDTREAKKRIGPLLHGSAVKLMQFSPDGARLVCVSHDAVTNDGRATVWGVATGRRLYEPLDVSIGPLELDIDQDGKRCAVAATRGVTIWDLATGIRVRPGFFAQANSNSARFVNDPRFMLVASQVTGRVKTWDITTGQPVRTVSNRRDLQSLALSDDKSLCLAGYGDGTARLLSLRDGTPAAPPFNCSSAVRAATIDQTGRWVATVTQNCNVLLWNAQTAELLAAIQPRDLEPALSQHTGLNSSIPLVFFSADNRYAHLVDSQGLVTSIELDPVHHRRSQIADEIEVSSGAEFDGAGGLRTLDPSELAARWRAVGRHSTAKKPDSPLDRP